MGDSIVCLGELGGRETRRVIDARGLAVAPGFIDIHTHSDDTVLANPKMESKVRQGITTEVCGNCGDSAAPVQGKAEIGARKRLQHYGVELSWHSLEEWFQRLEDQGISTNVVTLIGHGTLRASIMGHDMRPPTQEEMLAMRSLLAESMESGAFGLSTGLIYPPSSYAGLDELVELSKVAASHGGLYASHLRNEGDRLIEAVAEAVAVSERAGIPVELSHHKAAGKANWGKVQQSLELIEKARCRGLDVSLDQ
ncbi:MAG: amidohydrolase family protein [Chloroflexota bacterium]